MNPVANHRRGASLRRAIEGLRSLSGQFVGCASGAPADAVVRFPGVLAASGPSAQPVCRGNFLP